MGVGWRTSVLKFRRKFSNVIPRRFFWVISIVALLVTAWELLAHYPLFLPQRTTKVLPWRTEVNAGTKASKLKEDWSLGKGPSIIEISAKKQTISTATCELPKVAASDVDTGRTMLQMYTDPEMQHIWQSNYFALETVKYDDEVVKKQPKLKVFVVPFTHVDPGWLKSFDDYSLETDQTLNNIVDYLPSHPNMTFMWTEICFLHKWWSHTSKEKKEIFKKLVESGQVDITGGGWVMTDEASPHYWATIDNLIEGHQFLKTELNVRPEVAWSNDPFGYGATVPHLFKKANISSSVIHRIHRVLKVYYGREKLLDFNHRQHWDVSGKNDVFVTVLRGHHYDILNTCGPTPSVCCQFDFKRLTNFGCPGPKPDAITEANIKQKSRLLYDQYRQMAQLYRKSAILIPLGDDFRFGEKSEFDQQHDNYQKLFAYMNSQPDWNIEASFSTYSRYFREVRSTNNITSDFPVLTGDFYPYADTGEHLWTGYFSSRPFYKKIERILQSRIRAADILANLAALKLSQDLLPTLLQAIITLITEARRDLALFQHHDAITGTSRPHVVKDYGFKLWTALKKTDLTIAACVQIILTKKLPNAVHNSNFSAKEHISSWEISGVTHEMNEKTLNETELPSRVPLVVQKLQPTKLTLVNQLPDERNELIRILIKTPEVQVLQEGKPILAQLNPHILTSGKVDPITFELVFIAKLKPLSLTVFTLKHSGSIPSTTIFAQISSKNPILPNEFHTGFQTETLQGSTFTLKSPTVETLHSADSGMLLKWNDARMAMEFWMYQNTRSGPYIFLPSASPQLFSNTSTSTIVVKGVITSEVFTFFPNVHHHFTLINSTESEHKSLRFSNYIDMAGLTGSEIVLRIRTEVSNKERYFFTDQNGFQRKVEENYYPIAAAVFMQDHNSRVTLFSAQPHGASSPEIGLLEVMLHRVSSVDDTKGLGVDAIMKETVPTRGDFRLVVESFVGALNVGHQIFQFSLYTVLVLHQLEEIGDITNYYSPLKTPFPCDLELLHLRFINSPNVRLLILQRLAFECSLASSNQLNCPLIDSGSPVELLTSLKVAKLQKTSLSGIYDAQETFAVSSFSATILQPMDIQSFKLIS